MTIPGFSLTAALRTVTRKQGVGNLRLRGRQAVALGIAIAILCIPALVFGAPSASAKVSTGSITVDGTVVVNSTPARSGQTVFSGSTISTGDESRSLIDLGNSARLKLDSDTSLTIGFSESNFTGSLNKGSIDYVSAAGVNSEIVTADGIIASDARQSAQFHVQVVEGNTTVAVESGKVELRKGASVRTVSAGETYSTGSSSAFPQQNNLSGKKKGLIILFGGIAAVVIWIIIHNHNNCTPIVSGTGAGTCQ